MSHPKITFNIRILLQYSKVQDFSRFNVKVSGLGFESIFEYGTMEIKCTSSKIIYLALGHIRFSKKGKIAVILVFSLVIMLM